MEGTRGIITPEGISDLKGRIGSYYHGGPFILQVTKDSLINYVRTMGCQNPLYCNEEYAKTTRYGSLIGFPTYLNCITHTSGTPVGGLPGVMSYHAGNDWRWYHVIKPGDRIGTVYRPIGVEEKESKFAGKTLIIYADIIYYNQLNQIVGRSKGWSIRAERKAASERGKYSQIDKPKYTNDQLNMIANQQLGTDIRLETARWWEDVKIGDEITPLIKGPLRIIEVALCFIGGAGQHYGAGAMVEGAHYYSMKEYRKHAAYAEADSETGIADHPHKGHWEAAITAMLGVPGAYDVAPQRCSWLAEAVVNWIGNDGFLRKLYIEYRRFNVEGDTTWVKGQVSKKWVEGKQHIVELEINAINQREEITTPVKAEVVLPARTKSYEVPI